MLPSQVDPSLQRITIVGPSMLTTSYSPFSLRYTSPTWNGCFSFID